jgi:hypothetical protein
MKVHWLCAGLMAFSALSANAADFRSGNWQGSAFFDNSGHFTHCAMSASYGETLFLFSINNSYHWTMGFANPQWNLEVGKVVPLRYYIDRGSVMDAKATVIGKDIVSIELQSTASLFERMRKGWTLYLQAEGKDFTFSLEGTYRALDTLLNCAHTQIAGIGSQPATNSSTPTATSSLTPTDSSRLEATTVVANLLSQAGMTGYTIVPAAQVPDAMSQFDVVWTGPGLIGALKVIPAAAGITAGDITTTLIATDNKVCKGEFTEVDPIGRTTGTGLLVGSVAVPFS